MAGTPSGGLKKNTKIYDIHKNICTSPKQKNTKIHFNEQYQILEKKNRTLRNNLQ